MYLYQSMNIAVAKCLMLHNGGFVDRWRLEVATALKNFAAMWAQLFFPAAADTSYLFLPLPFPLFASLFISI